MTRALVTSSKYSPGNMKPEALEALFVGREKILSDVLARIAASATSRNKHFVLLVGPRGIGKTHFVALLHHRLTTAPEYAAARQRLKIAYLNEEEWGVASFLDLLVRILNALASGEKGLAERVEAVYDANEKAPLHALEIARNLLVEVVGDKTLLVLCENLVDLFEGLGEEGQRRWRAFIQERPFWTILATAPALFAGVQLQTSPFYGFFTERRLEKLDFETALQLLTKKAVLDGRHDLAELLGQPTGRARVRAIHHLAGGNHRVYVAMSEFLDRESLDDLVTPFLRMVDDLTPYYQDRMRQLAPLQRKLIEFLSRHETPAMVKEIARRCLVSQQTAAKQLGELARLGFVLSQKSGRATYYELAEPLMRICVEVKDNKTEHLRLFVRFLRGWFSARELRERFAEVCRLHPTERRIDRIHMAVALEDLSDLKSEPFLNALALEGLSALSREDFAGAAEALGRVADERNDEAAHISCADALLRGGRQADALARIARARTQLPNSHALAGQYAELLSHSKRTQEALHEIDRAIRLKADEPWYHCVRSKILFYAGQYEEVLKSVETTLRLDPQHVHCLEWSADALLQLGRLGEAEARARVLLKSKTAERVAWWVLSQVSGRKAKYDEALRAIDRALRIDPNRVQFLCFRGHLLEMLGEHSQVVANETRLLSLDPTHIHSLYTRASSLLALDRVDDAARDAAAFLKEAPEDAEGLALASEIEAHRHGLEIGTAHLVRLLSNPRVNPTIEDRGIDISEVLARMMMADATKRGWAEMPRHVAAARSSLPSPGIDGLLPAALTLLVDDLIRGSLIGAEEVEGSIQLLSTVLADIPDCVLPLRVLAGAARYSRSRDIADLLHLPLEQRVLVEDAVQGLPRIAKPERS